MVTRHCQPSRCCGKGDWHFTTTRRLWFPESEQAQTPCIKICQGERKLKEPDRSLRWGTLKALETQGPSRSSEPTRPGPRRPTHLQYVYVRIVHFPLCFLSVFGVASKQKAVTKPQSILDAVPSKAFSLPSYKPAGGRVFKPVTNAALRPTSNEVLKHVGNTVQGNKDILGGATPASRALAAALDDLDTNMGDTPTPLPVDSNTAQPQALGCNLPPRPPALPTDSSSGRVPFIA